MNTNSLKNFATAARTQLIREVNDQLTAVLASDSLARKERPADVRRLEKEEKTDRKQLVERVAYTWFNRLAALTYMDRNGYSADLFAELQTAHVVTPAEGQRVPELLQLARAGQFDSALKLDKDRLTRLLTGQLNSENADAEVYRALLIATCNLWHDKMPFLFEKLDDYTELLVPSDLLSERSVLSAMQNELTAEVCEDVEVIGWLYQFYIADLKAEIDAAVKKGKKVEAETLPAKTGLYTPHWVVKYLVQNSLGRLWLLNNPSSDLTETLEYYIDPQDEAGDFLKIEDPEKIKFCDPACGSGHILTYAFDVLMQIYTSKSYRPSEAVASILQHNLFGVEIDKRAGDLAALALTMKARAYDKRFFRRSEIAVPNICILENVTISDQELESYVARVGRDLFTADLKETLSQFEDARNVGSLIQPAIGDVEPVVERIDGLKFGEDLFLEGTHRKVQLALKQAFYLSRRYHVVIANPPYLWAKHMNAKLKTFAKAIYPDSKSDLFAMFMEKALALTVDQGMVGMINMQSWMFLSSYEDLRTKLFESATILSMAHLGERGFDTIGGAVVSTTAFVLENALEAGRKGAYLRLIDEENESVKSEKALQAIRDPKCDWFYLASVEQFGKIPGRPIAYWDVDVAKMFVSSEIRLSNIGQVKVGLQTGNNDRYIRRWFEIFVSKINDRENAEYGWTYLNKGKSNDDLIGNEDYIINWAKCGESVKSESGSVIRNEQFYFKSGLTWTLLGGTGLRPRFISDEYIFDRNGIMCFPKDEFKFLVFALLWVGYADRVLSVLNPTLSFQATDVAKLPIVSVLEHQLIEIKSHILTALKSKEMILERDEIRREYVGHFIQLNYTIFDSKMKMEAILADVNESIGRAFESVKSIVNEGVFNMSGVLRFVPEVPPNRKIYTMVSNYELDLLSYYLGILFGRYSLDKPGLILANAGEGMKEYLAQVPEPSFMPDEDGIVPFVESGWFKDDVVREWERFLTVAFGKEHLEENKAFVKETLGKSVRQYFLKDFYPDHIKRYKKRPIYWMFASQPEKGRGIPAFQCLVYLHRYTTDTCGKIMEDYLKPLIRQLEDKLREAEEIGSSTSEQISAREKTQALKDADDFRIKLKECKTYAETLQPYVDNPIALDLDDGVLVNYNRFGKAVKLVPGLNEKKQRDQVRGFDWCDVSKVPEYGE